MANNKPRIRIHGNLDPLEDSQPLTAEDTREYADSIVNEAQAEVLKTQLQVDFSISILGLARFRVNVCDQRGGLGLVFRDRKSTRLNSSHTVISYAVFCLNRKH